MKRYVMKYREAAEDSLKGWENQSLPVGNGYFGASVFGGTEKERVQFTTNEFANVYSLGGVTSFADLYIESACGEVACYERGLDLNRGEAYSSFVCGEGKIKRTAFCSYPDNVFLYGITSEREKNFTARVEIPYLGAREEKDGGRRGNVYAEGDSLVLRQYLPLRECIGELRLSVLTDGKVSVTDKEIRVTDAKETAFLVVLGTNYKLCPEVFEDGCHKATGEDPDEKLREREKNAREKGFKELSERHVADYGELINRASVDLGGKNDGRTVNELLDSYKRGKKEPYLIETYFRYGRHLLVSSSRKGTPPASLQGTWSAHDKSPWGSGIWHNINVQMNYWCALNANIPETFAAYADYWKAYLKRAEEYAKEWAKDFVPEKADEDCGWVIGTAAFLYEISGLGKFLHSGPGTGGLTAKMFADYYDFTLDEEFLKNYAYPAVHGAARFMQKSVKKFGNEYLCTASASPEQILSGVYLNGYKEQQYYATVGCAFDQQMICEIAKDDIRFSEILGKEDETVKKEKRRIERFSPVNIGYSGQVKEYGEENFYGEIGAALHRHVSQLMGLMPGSIINEDTPAWLDSAKRTLDLRGDDSTGWALAYRILCRARARDGENAYKLLRKLLCEKTNDNLWDEHPPFQIDGNFGATAGIAEMLLQSRSDGSITLFPAIPEEWKNVGFENLRARGDFIVSARRAGGKTEYCRIKSLSGGDVFVFADGIEGAIVTGIRSGERIKSAFCSGKIAFRTEKGGEYEITGFSEPEKTDTVKNLAAEWKKGGVLLKWRGGGKHAVYRAAGNDKDYKLLAVTDKRTFTDEEFSLNKKARLTYKVVEVKGAYSQKSQGGVVFLHPATELEEERYKRRFKVNNLYADEWKLR